MDDCTPAFNSGQKFPTRERPVAHDSIAGSKHSPRLMFAESAHTKASMPAKDNKANRTTVNKFADITFFCHCSIVRALYLES